MTGEITGGCCPPSARTRRFWLPRTPNETPGWRGRLDTVLKGAELLGGDLTWDENGTTGRSAEVDHAAGTRIDLRNAHP